MPTPFIMNSKLLVITLGLISSSFQQTVVSACADSTWLAKFGLNATAATVIANNLCTGFYNTDGACVDATAVKNYFTSLTQKYAARATDAADSANLLSLQDTYFKAVNGNKTTLTEKSTLPGIFGSIVDTLKKTFNTFSDFFTDVWKSASTWVLSLFNKTSGAINPCFQAWNGLSNGAFCALTSKNALNKEAVVSGANTFYRFQTATNVTGIELVKCLPLVDNYCVLTHGISISTNFTHNRTYNWADNGLSKQNCIDLQTNYNLTTDAGVKAKHDILIAAFNTEDFNFIRTAADIQAMYTFLRANNVQQPSAFVPISQNINKGLIFASLTAGSDFKDFGAKANFTIPTYTAGTSNLKVVKKAILTSIITFFGLLVMLMK